MFELKNAHKENKAYMRELERMQKIDRGRIQTISQPGLPVTGLHSTSYVTGGNKRKTGVDFSVLH